MYATTALPMPMKLNFAQNIDVTGKKTVEYSKPKPNRYLTASFYFWQIVKIGAAFVMGLLLFWRTVLIAEPG
jgi:hypothetical protein